jgi:very-short-patch-repair endonuclease
MRQSIVQTVMARDLRQDMVSVEHQLWSILRNRQLGGHKFRRKAPLGPFIVDFLCLEARLIIAIDRGPDPACDPGREAWLQAQFYTILHLSDHDIRHDLSGCLAQLKARVG